MGLKVCLKSIPNNPITIENLESFIVGTNSTSITDSTKTLPIIINRSQTYLFVGKEKSVIIEGSDILYLMTEKN